MTLENYPASDETKERARQLVKTALAFHSAAAQVAGQAERFDAIAAAGQAISVLSVQEAVPTKMLTAVILTHHKARRGIAT